MEPLGEQLLVDAAGVRVWADVVPPGGAQPLHTHTNPYVSVTVTPVRAQIVDADGTVMYDVDRAPGVATYFGPDRVPVTHSLRNVGDQEVRVVVVELLPASGSG